VKNKRAAPGAQRLETEDYQETDLLLQELALLYRARLRAHYNDDIQSLQVIDQKISDIKAKLANS
jgi:hypothetical protein